MSSEELVGAWKEQAVGRALGHLCLIGRVPEGAGSSQVPGWAASCCCVALAKLLTLPEFQPPIGKMAHRGVRRFICAHEGCGVNTLGLQVGGVIGGAES